MKNQKNSKEDQERYIGNQFLFLYNQEHNPSLLAHWDDQKWNDVDLIYNNDIYLEITSIHYKQTKSWSRFIEKTIQRENKSEPKGNFVWSGVWMTDQAINNIIKTIKHKDKKPYNTFIEKELYC